MDYLTYMMDPRYVFISIAAFVLFFLLSPGLFIRIPAHGSKLVVTIVHAILFVLLAHTCAYFIYVDKIEML